VDLLGVKLAHPIGLY
jgi:hypothetical protein